MKIKIIILSIISTFLFNANVFAFSISSIDKIKIKHSLKNLVQSINTGDIQKISELILPAQQALKSEIQEQVIGGIAYELDYAPFDENIDILSADEVRVNAKFAAAGPGWNINGLGTYFTFQKQDNKWMIADTDFHKKLGTDYVFDIFKKIYTYAGPVLILLFMFWLWMLIDCIKREFDDKSLWIILMIFLSIIGSILYFFIIKRKNIVRKPLVFKI
ncbi:MAG: PLD nuclease N-terminal domain-containing protein [Candidatus Gracilibacteria bacterium]|nr:PLD nuclease N-terminal domain-containing protein [Candidatus Gracilibacteria bacterium]